MGAMRLALGVATGLGLAAAGCGPDTHACRTDCPIIADTYAIESNTVTGSCFALPALVPPSLELRQSPDGRQAAAVLFDPVDQLPIEVTSQVLVPTHPGTDLVAALSGFAYTSRQPTAGVDHLVELRHFLTASIVEVDHGRREIIGTLSTTSFPMASASAQPSDPSGDRRAGPTCSQTITFTGFSTGLTAR